MVTRGGAKKRKMGMWKVEKRGRKEFLSMKVGGGARPGLSVGTKNLRIGTGHL